MSLTPEMKDWLKAHTGFDSAGRLKKRGISKAMQKFWRRRDKIKAAIDGLPPGSAAKAGLENRLGAITDPLENVNNATAQDLKVAYAQLSQIKIDSRSAMASERGALSPLEIYNEMVLLRSDVEAMYNGHQAIIPGLRIAYSVVSEEVSDMTPASQEIGYGFDSVCEKYAELTRDFDRLDGDLDQLDTRAAADIAAYDAAHASPLKNVISALDAAEKKLEIIKSDDPNANTDRAMAEIGVMRSQIGDNKLLDLAALRNDAAALAKGEREFVQERKRILLEMSSLQNRDTVETTDGMPKSQADLDQALGKIREREADRLEKAKQAMLDAYQRDMAAIDPSSAGWRSGDDQFGDNPTNIPTFDPLAFGADLDEPPLESASDVERKTFVVRTSQFLMREISDLKRRDPSGDVLMDMALKSKEEWQSAMMKAAGFRGHVADLPKKTRAMIKQIAANAFDLANSEYPNQAAADMKSFTLNGQTFTYKKRLTKGGAGEVHIFENPATGEEVVLKTPIGDIAGDGEEWSSLRGDFVSEARAHNRATGGAAGQTNPYLIDMRGLVMGPGNLPLVVMELAGGGDLAAKSSSSHALRDAGLISPAAHQAMVKDTVREVAQALKAMEDNHVTHYDIKDLNVFLTEDGHVKLGDFGLGEAYDQRGDLTRNPMTGSPEYEAPEMREAKKMSSKSDAFSLGVLMQNLLDPYVGGSEVDDGNFGLAMQAQTNDSLDRGGSAVKFTAFDRLRNAIMEEDPEMRPSMSAVLTSSFLDEADANYQKSDLDELQAATTAYSKAVGKQVGNLNRQRARLEGEILNLEREKAGDLAVHMIAYLQRRIDDGNVELRKWKRKLAKGEANLKISSVPYDALTDEQRTAKAPRHVVEIRERYEADERYVKDRQISIDREASNLENFASQQADWKKKLGADAVTEERRAKIDDQIAQKRNQIQQLRSQIDQINSDPSVAPLLARLQAANEAFAR